MSFNTLLTRWANASIDHEHARGYHVRLPPEDAARVAALTALYPGREEGEIIRDLLRSALDELERSLPYVAGSRVVTEDEFGDPIYEDVGPTPRYHELKQRFCREMLENTSN